MIFINNGMNVLEKNKKQSDTHNTKSNKLGFDPTKLVVERTDGPTATVQLAEDESIDWQSMKW